MKIIALLLWSLLVCSVQNVCGMALSASMGELMIRNLQPGTTVQLTPLMHLPWRLNYKGNEPVQILVRPAFPDADEMKSGYEKIPDLNWVHLDPQSFELNSSSEATSNVSITVPDEDQLLGEKYIVYLWAMMVYKKSGISTGLGVKSRLLLSVAPKRIPVESQPVTKTYMEFRINPEVILLKNVPLGKKLKVSQIAKKKFWIENFGSEKRTFSISPVSGISLGTEPSFGMEWGPQDTEIKIVPQQVLIEKGQKGKFNLILRLPKKEEYKGRKFQYLFRISSDGEGVTSGILLKLDVETAR